MNLPIVLFAPREKSSGIPQADEVERIPELVQLVGGGVRNSREIAKKMHFDRRQSEYYREAAEILGLLNRRKPYSLTDLGRQFFVSDDLMRLRIMVCALLRYSIIGCVVACLQSHAVKTVSKSDIESLIEGISSLRPATVERGRTIFAWLRWLAENSGIIVVVGDVVRLRPSNPLPTGGS